MSWACLCWAELSPPPRDGPHRNDRRRLRLVRFRTCASNASGSPRSLSTRGGTRSTGNGKLPWRSAARMAVTQRSGAASTRRAVSVASRPAPRSGPAPAPGAPDGAGTAHPGPGATGVSEPPSDQRLASACTETQPPRAPDGRPAPATGSPPLATTSVSSWSPARPTNDRPITRRAPSPAEPVERQGKTRCGKGRGRRNRKVEKGRPRLRRAGDVGRRRGLAGG